MREDVDVSVTVRGQHADTAVFADQPVPDWETVILLNDVAKSVT